MAETNRRRQRPQTYRRWLQNRIQKSRRTALQGRYAETRKIAEARSQVYAIVLREMEKTGADLLERFRGVS